MTQLAGGSAVAPRLAGAEANPRSAARTIAVTGGAGFIGSHLCEALVGAGHTVVCLDNFQTGRRANVEFLRASGKFILCEHDVVEPWPDGLPRFDEIYHLACPASPAHYQSDRVKTALTCALGTLGALRRAQADKAILVHASTSEVYGDPEVHPQIEGYFGNVNSVGPRSCYDEGKRFAETLATDFGRQNGVVIRMTRIFNTFGPRMQANDGRVVSNFIVQALQGADITIYGAGDQTRSFCFVDDMVEGLRRLMDDGERVVGPVNMGSPVETTIVELARIVVDMTGSRSRIVHRPLPIDDPRRRRPDISKARALLGWRPEISLRDGLARTIAYFERELQGDAAPIGMRASASSAPARAKAEIGR